MAAYLQISNYLQQLNFMNVNFLELLQMTYQKRETYQQ